MQLRLVGIDEDLSFYEGAGEGPDVTKGKDELGNQSPSGHYNNTGLRQRQVYGYMGRRRNREVEVRGRYDVREKKLSAILTRNARCGGQHHEGAW